MTGRTNRRVYILYWLDKTEEMVQGTSILNALGRAGYNMRDMIFLDYYKDATGVCQPTSRSKPKETRTEGPTVGVPCHE